MLAAPPFSGTSCGPPYPSGPQETVLELLPLCETCGSTRAALQRCPLCEAKSRLSEPCVAAACAPLAAHSPIEGITKANALPRHQARAQRSE
jgi:hypothetical protein